MLKSLRAYLSSQFVNINERQHRNQRQPHHRQHRQTRALGIACHAHELASPCCEDTCDCYPLGLRPRRQHSMPHHHVARSARGLLRVKLQLYTDGLLRPHMRHKELASKSPLSCKSCPRASLLISVAIHHHQVIKDYHQCNHSPSQLEVSSSLGRGKQFMHKRLQC